MSEEYARAEAVVVIVSLILVVVSRWYIGFF